MENDSIDLPLDIYLQCLRSIKEIEFTQREVDILSCLVRGKSTRTIPSFLSIAARTVASHISRIRLKTGCTSQTSIVDFVESSGKASILKEQYYLSLSNQVSFEKLLRKIPKVESAKAPLCLIVYEREQKDKYSFIHYLEDHLRLAGFKIEIKIKEGQKSIIDFLGERETQQDDHILYIVPQPLELHQVSLDCYNEKCILLLPDKIENLKEFSNINSVDFSGTANYYFSFFNLLMKLKIDFNFDKIIGDFKESCKEVLALPEAIEVSTYPEIQKRTNAHFLQVRLKQRSKIVSFVFLILSFICIILFVVHWSLGTSHTNSIRSDLPIPTELSFLNRPGLMVQLNDKLKGQQGIQTVALVGIGGAGKTTLARQYAHSQSPPVVWEINAETQESLTASFENLAWALSTTEEDQKALRGLKEIKDPLEREGHLTQFVKHHLKAISNWFLIYDNVEKFSDIQKYFPQDSNTWGKGKIIITTRDENIGNNKYINGTISIGELDSHQKLSLFNKIMSGGNVPPVAEAPEEGVNKFLEYLPPFPLDISVAAYYLKATHIPYKNYLENLGEHNKNFEKVQKNLLKESGGYTKTRYGIITFSLQHLMEMNKDFKDLLLFISLLDSQNIPRKILNKYKNNIIVDDFIYNLKKYSLLTKQLSPSDSAISMHRSTQAIILAYLTDLLTLEEKDDFLSAIVKTIEIYMNAALDGADYLRARLFFTHLEAFLSHDSLLNKEIEATITGILGCIYNRMGDYEKSKKLLIKSIAGFDQVESKNYIKISKLLGHLGLIYSNLGDYEKASHSLEQSYKYSRNNFAENHTIIVMALDHLGGVYRSTGQYDKSLSLLRECLAICKKYFPENHVKRGEVLVYLGQLYITLGHTDNALILLEKALGIYKQNVPEDDVPINWVLGYLGNAYLEQGNYEKAKDLLEQSLTIAKKHFPENHPWIHWVLIDLGLVYSKLGDHKKGIALLDTSLKGYETHYGQGHIETAGVLKNLGQAYFAQGDNNTAEKLFNKALAIFQKYKHPERYICLENLSDLYQKKISEGYRQQAQYLKEQALTYLKQALEIVKAHFPEDSPHLKRIEEKLKALEQ